jgi:hypothetical protein
LRFWPGITDDLIQVVAEFVTFGLEIAEIVFARRHLNRDTLHDPKAVAFEANNLPWIVCEQANISHTKIM